VISLVEGDGRLGPSKTRQGSEGVDGIHLLLSDAELSVGLICLGAPKDHEAMIDLRELGIILRVASASSLAFNTGFWAFPAGPGYHRCIP
jgi:hypothetical protein